MRLLIAALDRLHGRLGRLVSLLEAMQGQGCEHCGSTAPHFTVRPTGTLVCPRDAVPPTGTRAC